jgi:hypothetical protein
MSGGKWDYLLLGLAGLTVTALAGWLQSAPGYMDADYYYAAGMVLLEGGGFSQPFLWNYLDGSVGLPAPAFTYWMPMGALLAAMGGLVSPDFFGARLPFWLLAAFVPPTTLRLGLALHQDQRKAFVGALFSLFPVYYLAYLPTTDVFSVYMLAGAGMLLVFESRWVAWWQGLALGFLAGVMHLARADGILWLAGGLAWVIAPTLLGLWKREKLSTDRWLATGAAVLFLGAGYLLPMTAWYGRNLQTWGWFFPPGNSATLWLTRYEDTFLYPPVLLTAQRWWEAGWPSILTARWEALLANVQTWIGVQGTIVLLPFTLVGMALLWRKSAVRWGAWLWLITLGLMTIIFPYAGINGSFFHSGAAFQPLIWACAPVGIEAVIGWLARKRKWQKGRQVQVFVETILLISCFLLTGFMYFQRVIGEADEGPLAWNLGAEHYRQIEQRLDDLGATPCLTVMVNNPPGYYAVTRRPAVVIPYGDEKMLLAAAERFDARYLVVGQNDAGHLSRLFYQPGNFPGLHYLGEVEGNRLYAIDHQP